MIHEVDTILQTLLAAELRKVPGCPVTNVEQITFLPPAPSFMPERGGSAAGRKEGSEGKEKEHPGLNLYMVNLRENLALRDETFQRQGQPGMRGLDIRRAPARFDLFYLLTVTGQTGIAEHRLLTDVLGILMRFQVVDPQYLTGTLAQMGANSLMLSVGQPDHPVHDDPTSLWQAMGLTLRPALGLIATAMFNPFVSRWTPLVLEAVTGVGQGADPSGPQRPLDITSLRVSLLGIVLDQIAETPVGGAVITLEGRGEKTTTDAKGFFHFRNLPPGVYSVQIDHLRYTTVVETAVVPPLGQPNQLKPLIVALSLRSDEALANVTAHLLEQERNVSSLIEMERETHVSIAGRLRFADGRPAAYIPVRRGRQRTTTNAEGIYVFFAVSSADLPEDGTEEQEIVVEVPGHGDAALPARSPARSEGRAAPTWVLPAPANPGSA